MHCTDGTAQSTAATTTPQWAYAERRSHSAPAWPCSCRKRAPAHTQSGTAAARPSALLQSTVATRLHAPVHFDRALLDSRGGDTNTSWATRAATSARPLALLEPALTATALTPGGVAATARHLDAQRPALAAPRRRAAAFSGALERAANRARSGCERRGRLGADVNGVAASVLLTEREARARSAEPIVCARGCPAHQLLAQPPNRH